MRTVRQGNPLQLGPIHTTKSSHCRQRARKHPGERLVAAWCIGPGPFEGKTYDATGEMGGTSGLRSAVLAVEHEYTKLEPFNI